MSSAARAAFGKLARQSDAASRSAARLVRPVAFSPPLRSACSPSALACTSTPAKRTFTLTSSRCSSSSDTSPTSSWTSASNYFEILDLPSEGLFELDEGALRRTFLLKSRAVHPDGFKGAGEGEYQAAQQQSAFLNTAYETLKSPFTRAQYLLSLKDIHVNETDAVSDQELLIDIMEAREAIDEAGSEEEVEALRDQHRERARAAISGLAEAFKAGDLQRARDLTIELRYWLNVDTAGKDKLHPNE